MSCQAFKDEVRYRSVRTHRGAPPASLAASYRPVDEPFDSRPETLENFLTERYCFYSAGAANRASGSGRVRRGDVHHRLWPLQPAEAEVEELDMTAQIGVALPDTVPILHYARRLDVVAWFPKRLDA